MTIGDMEWSRSHLDKTSSANLTNIPWQDQLSMDESSQLSITMSEGFAMDMGNN